MVLKRSSESGYVQFFVFAESSDIPPVPLKASSLIRHVQSDHFRI